jgi:hypothetical protein
MLILMKNSRTILPQRSMFNIPTNYHPPLSFCLFCSDTTSAAAVLSPVPLPSLVTLDVSSAAHHDNQAISDIMGA